MTDTGVRLVIWDLDETFWDGTLTEGGVCWRADRREIVVELARRGIMSAICSKNDFAPVRDLLAEKGVWDYFIFPSIDWTPKGERIKAIVEDAQLRAENVVFVDDNANNRAQAMDLLPELRAFDVDKIELFLADPDFRGKSDPELTRLRQYKLLEAKKSERATFVGDANAFLRQSRISVDFITDVEHHVARAVELVNRTNQLNFTKRRLPADPQAAAAELLAEIGAFSSRAGLVTARDRYGDYGVVGFFLMTGLLSHHVKLRHFCFSCRTLGMGVEQYVYDLLGRPSLDIVGPVVSDPFARVDWIENRSDRDAEEASGDRIDEVRLRGGCELEVLDYLFRHRADRISGEYQVAHGIYQLPVQHSFSTAIAARRLNDEERGTLDSLGLARAMTQSRFFDPCDRPTLLILSTALDVDQAVWRHRKTGMATPVRFRPMIPPSDPHHHLSTPADRAEYGRVMEILDRDFEPLAWPFAPDMAEARRLLLERAPANALLIVILPNDRRNNEGTPVQYWQQTQLNADFLELGRGRDNVVFIETNDLIHDIGEVGSYYLHYERVVYIRLFERILAVWKNWRARADAHAEAMA